MPYTIVVPYHDDRPAVPSGTHPRGAEAMLVSGENPSLQRNVGVAAAGNDTVVFLDDDSAPVAGYFQRAMAALSAPGVDAVAGPRLGCADPGPACRVFDGVYRSPVAMGPARPRYDRVGGVREASERDTILANLVMDREAFADADGFDERLYPNEENELLSRLADAGRTVLYDPGLAVRHCRVEPLRSFAARFVRYGRGRATQMHAENTAYPVYLLPAVALLAMTGLLAGSLLGAVPALLPATLAAAYLAVVSGDGLVRAASRRHPLYALSSFLTPVVHGGYALGMLIGLVRPYRRGGTVDHIERVSLSAVEESGA